MGNFLAENQITPNLTCQWLREFSRFTLRTDHDKYEPPGVLESTKRLKREWFGLVENFGVLQQNLPTADIWLIQYFLFHPSILWKLLLYRQKRLDICRTKGRNGLEKDV